MCEAAALPGGARRRYARWVVAAMGFHTATALARPRASPLRHFGATPTLVCRRGHRVYDAPALYDAAFAFRDFEDEVDFLVEAHARAAGSRPRRVLELMAGPARHAIEAARRGLEATAVDVSAAMEAYARTLAADEGAALAYVRGDVASAATYAGLRGFDAAWLLLGSAGYLLDADAAIDTLRHVGGALRAGGTLVLEVPHPRETFRLDDVGLDAWTAPSGDGGEVRVSWGGDDDAFDPLTQIRRASVTFEVADAAGATVETVEDTVPTREYTLQELLLLARCAGCFDVDTYATYGALDTGFVAADDDDLAFRLVLVLTKLEGA